MQPAPPPPPKTAPAPEPQRGNTAKRYLIVAALLVAAFLAGFLPQWLEARELRAQLERTDLELRLADAHRLLGVASHEALRNDYASAGRTAARFFDQAAALARLEALDADQRTRVALLSFTARRDAIMALLTAGDPSAAERLAEIYLTMNGALARRDA